MVDFNPKATALQAQLQAQLQNNRSTNSASGTVTGARLRPQDGVDERIRNRQLQDEQNRRLPVKTDNRVENLSSANELAVARERIDAVAGRNQREAPSGRTSQRQSSLRNQPLGQIIDIRV